MFSRDSLPLSLRYLFAFCGDRERNLHFPFSRGEWTFATDARIAIRIDRRKEVPEDLTTAEAIGGLPFPGLEIVQGSIEIPELPKRQFEDCPECREMSGGKPSPLCRECGGLGRVDKRIAIPLLGRNFDAYYLRLMKTFLKDVRIANEEPGDYAQLRFTFLSPDRSVREGSGVLMPFKPENR